MESQKASLVEKEERYNKIVKTLKAARSRIDALKAEKDQVHINSLHVFEFVLMCISGCLE